MKMIGPFLAAGLVAISLPMRGETLTEIAEFAQNICGDIPSGTLTRNAIQGKVEANLGALGKVLGLSGDLDASQKQTIYSGIPFEKLPDSIPTESMCKSELVKVLLQRKVSASAPNGFAAGHDINIYNVGPTPEQLNPNNPAGVVAAPVKMIAAAGDNLYQLFEDGRIWMLSDAKCSGDSCGRWDEVESKRKGRDYDYATQIAVAGDALYQKQTNGKIWRYNGRPCTTDGPNDCPGWDWVSDKSSLPDNESRTGAPTDIIAAGNVGYQLDNGKIWTTTTCKAGGVCTGWRQLTR